MDGRNISKHPDLYLEYCAKELAALQELYDAAILKVKTAVNLRRREAETAKEETMQYLGFLKEAKKALADTALAYPAKVGVFVYKNVGNLKEAVLATDSRLTELKGLSQSRENQVVQLQHTLDKLVKRRNEVKTERRNHDTRIAQAKTENLDKTVDGLKSRMDELISAAEAIPGVESAKPGATGKHADTNDVDGVFSRWGIK